MDFYFKTKEDYIIDAICYVLLAFIFIVTVYPFLNVLAVSLNDAQDSIYGGITIFPRKFTLFTYGNILKDMEVYQATWVSLQRTVIHSSLSVMVTIFTAYLLSRKEFVFGRFINFYLIVTMYISAGMIPSYILYTKLGFQANILVYMIPGLINVFNIIIVRTFIEGLPESFVESAKIDGAGDFTILFKIILPLILPVIAVIIIFVSINDWNAWFDTLLYGGGKKHMTTLQYKLMDMLASANIDASSTTTSGAASQSAAAGGMSDTVTPQSMRAAMTMIVTIPIMLVYPFFQRYFVTGMTLGGVKE